MTAQKARSPRVSETEMTELVLPQHANAIGTAFGGTILSWIDICAAICAHRHVGTVAVTAAIDDLSFQAPIRVGDVVRIHGRLNAAFNTSLEVEVVVEREDPATGDRTVCVDSFVTFVNIGDDGRPAKVPPLLAESPDDEARAQAAGARRKHRVEGNK